MARRKHTVVRMTRSRRSSSKAGAVLTVGLARLLVVAVAAIASGLLRLATSAGRTWMNHWRSGGARKRQWMLGGTSGVALLMVGCCGIGSITQPAARSQPAQGEALRVAVVQNQQAATPATQPSATVVAPTSTSTTIPPTSTATAAPFTATAVPLTATPAPPVGQVVQGGNLRRLPQIASDTVIGQLCPNDQLVYLSEQLVDGDRWYLVRVVAAAGSCGAGHVAAGTEGWANQTLLQAPSYEVRTYALLTHQPLPTAIVRPTAVPQRVVPPAPAAPAAPSGGRTGAICRDGSRSSATGRGACSHHGGVAQWLYR